MRVREGAESIGRDELIGRFAAVPGRLGPLLMGGSFVPRPGGWSAREEVIHLLVVECVVWWRRLDDLAAGGVPHWFTTEPELGTEPDDRPVDALLAAFEAARAATVARVAGLDDAGWARSGTHAKHGTLDVAGLVRLGLDHDEEHLAALG